MKKGGAICLIISLLVVKAVNAVAQRPDSMQGAYISTAYKKSVTPTKKLPALPYINLLSHRVSPALKLPQNFYTTNLGFFCTKELQLEKTTKIPFRFRLGSIDYCDVLEGKRR